MDDEEDEIYEDADNEPISNDDAGAGGDYGNYRRQKHIHSLIKTLQLHKWLTR